MFGPHLTLDLSECNPEKLSDLSYIYNLLDDLPDVINMHKITAPYVFVYKPKGNPTEWGISGFVIIAESHISIHTFPDNKHAFMDIFSCKQFDIHKAINYITSKLEAHKADKRLSGRGKEYPRQVLAARERSWQGRAQRSSTRAAENTFSQEHDWVGSPRTHLNETLNDVFHRRVTNLQK